MSQAELPKTLGSVSLIGLTALAGAVVGFFLQLLIAYYFGASNQTDAYFMAASTSELISKLLLGGSLAAVFLPMFVARLQVGQREEAWSLALNLLHCTTVIFIILLILLAWFAEPFVAFIASGFDQATQQLTVSILRVLLSSFLLLFLVDLIVSMLQALHQFAIPALLRVIAPAVSALAIIILARPLGIYALAIGAVVGSIIQVCFVAWGLSRQGFRYRFIFNPRDPSLRRLVFLVYPFIFSVVMTLGAGIVYRILVSHLSEGSLSSLKYAEKISQLITIMFLSSVTTVIYPLLSAKASTQDVTGMRDTVASAIRLTTFVIVPIMIGVALLRHPLIVLLYQRGQFSAEAAELTSVALLWLVVGLGTNAISSILGHATLAFQATRASVAISIASQVVAIVLFLLLVPRLAVAGLALASSIVPLSSGFLYFLHLTQYIPELWRIFWHATLAKILVLGGLLTAILATLLPYIGTVFSGSAKVEALLQVLVGTIVGSVFFFGIAYAWRIEEMHEVVQMIHKRFNRFRNV